jgi:opacity protein-like surface antigen
VLGMVLAATPSGAQVRAGLVGGVNRSSLRDKHEDIAYGSRVGFTVGGVVDLALTDVVGLRFEPRYIQKGGTGDNVALRERYEVRATMLEMPLLLKVSFGETTQPYLLAGPTAGLTLTSRVSGEDSGISFNGDLANVTRRIEIGLAVGAGLSHQFRRVTTFIEGRYVVSVTNMMRTGEVSLMAEGIAGSRPATFDEEEDQYRYRGLQALVGFTVPVGRRER